MNVFKKTHYGGSVTKRLEQPIDWLTNASTEFFGPLVLFVGEPAFRGSSILRAHELKRAAWCTVLRTL